MIEKLKQALEMVQDPSLKKTLKETNGLKYLGYDEEKDIINIIIAMGKKNTEDEKSLKIAITKIVKLDFNYRGIKIEIEELRSYNSIVNSNINFIGVMSGKGGVGKSTVIANIAYRLMKKGYKVGIIDADIYGSSIPTILEMPHSNPYYNEDKKIVPLEKENIEVISTEFFTNPSEPVIWRGGMLHSMLEHFFYDVAWNKKIEYMLIDLPPGTGDIMLDIHEMVPQIKLLLVTTPHKSASHVAIKAGYAAKKMNLDTIGIIENMSYYHNEANNKDEFLFGSGGGIEVAQNLGVELITQIPINQPIHHQNIYELDEKVGKIYDDLTDIVVYSFNKN